MSFKKHKAGNNTLLRDRTARKIADAIIYIQTKLAGRLSLWEKRYNVAQKKMMLLAFCLCVGSYCLYVLGSSLLAKEVPASKLKMQFNKGSPPLYQRPVRHNKGKDSVNA